MPKYAKEQREYHKSRIRAVLILSPRASLRDIQDTLQNSKTAPLRLDLEYISTIRNKILKERTYRNNNVQVKARIAQLQDHIEKLNEQLWQIAASKATAEKDRVAALKALAENELKLLQAEMDAGIYDRKLGTVEVEARRNQPIDKEHEAKVIEAFRSWGFIVDGEAVEIGRETKQLTPPDANNKPNQNPA